MTHGKRDRTGTRTQLYLLLVSCSRFLHLCGISTSNPGTPSVSLASLLQGTLEAPPRVELHPGSLLLQGTPPLLPAREAGATRGPWYLCTWVGAVGRGMASRSIFPPSFFPLLSPFWPFWSMCRITCVTETSRTFPLPPPI